MIDAKKNMFFVIACIASLSACSVSVTSNQLELLKRWARSQEKTEIENQLWTAKIGDYEQRAIPVAHDGYLTFYISDGTEIDFLDWDITALRNWNYYGRSIEINRTDTVLEHKLIDGNLIRMECSNYQKKNDSSGSRSEAKATNNFEETDLSRREAKCETLGVSRVWRYQNWVDIDASGGAVRMLHHIAPDMPPLELTLNRVGTK